jgi:tetratricopeptide (TPR) repeat protein
MDMARLPKPGENNLWYRYNDNDAVLVFVHGVLSDSHGCWLYKDESTNDPVCYWPELIESDARFNNPGIYLAGYHTEIDSGDFPIEQCALQVYSYLKTPDPQGRPPVMDKKKIIFICHSMGGIVARDLLCEQREAFKDKQVGIVLIASPSYGSQLARTLEEVIYLYNHAQGKQLKWGNPMLQRLDDSFKNLYDGKKIPNLCGVEFFENRFVIHSKWRWLPLFLRTKIVSKESGARYFAYAKQVGGSDHFSICKPRTKSDPVHQYLLEFLVDKNLLPSEPAVSQPTNGEPAPVDRPGSTRPVAPSPFPTVSSIQFNFITQGSGGVLLQPRDPLEPGLQPTQLASQLSMMFAGPSATALMQAVQEKPRLEELFEVITDPDVVFRALFQTEQTAGLAPYDVAYVNAREDIGDVQEALETALREAKGRLLVCGPRGIGKTREIAELARAACATKWKILVARNEGNPRLGPLLSIPPELIDARLLIVIDNLHLRISTGADQPAPPYLERLERLLEWLERQLPGNVRLLATARDEPRFQKDLDLPQEKEKWHGFGVFRLPRLTDEGLRQILSTLAAQASVAVAADDIAKLIENSDRKPATVFINVDLARQKNTALTQTAWKPTEGEPWRLRFADARAEYGGVDRVCQTLYLLTQAGLPARIPYVSTLARAVGESYPENIVQALVGEGLLRMRQGILTPFSNEQLQELLGANAVSAIKLNELADTIERAITDADSRPKEWPDDLLAFALGLDRAGNTERAEQAASRAVDLGVGGARAYRIRAAIRFERRDLSGIEADLTKAIEMGEDEADTRFGRAAIRNLLGNFTAALDDLDFAVRHGRDDAAVHAQRGTAYYQLGQWADADAAMTAAIERGETSGMIFFSRGMARFQLNDAAGAEQDLSATLERGVDFAEAADQLSQIERAGALKPARSPGDGPGRGDAFVYALRGFARFKLGKNAAAEEDFTAAIAGGAGARFNTFMDTLKQSTLPLLAQVKAKLKDLPVPFGEGVLFHLRGVARLNQGKLNEAEADFEEAIARGYAEGEVYFGRGSARLRMEKFTGAEEDATAAIERGKRDAFTYALRGVALLALKSFFEAEKDFTKAIELDGENAQFFIWRGGARMQQQKLADAEADLSAALDRRAEPQIMFSRGCVRFDLQKYPEAENDFTAAKDLGFEPPALFTFRGIARLTQNNLAGAEEDAIAAFNYGAADFQAYSLRAAVRLAQERYAEAEADLSAAIDLGRKDAWILFHRGKARQALERYPEAEQDYDATLALGKEAAIAAEIVVADVFVNRGRARLAQQKWSEAQQDFSTAIEAGRDDAFVHVSLGRAHQEQKHYLEAETEYDLAVARDSQPALRNLRGCLRLIRGNFRGAENDFDEAIARDPADANAFYTRGLSQYAQRKYAEARADYDAALALAPNDARCVGARVLVNLRLRDLENAAKDCGQLDALDRDGPETVGCYGVLGLARGDFDEAMKRLTAAAQRDSSWYFWQGLVLLLLGRFEEAREASAKATAENTPADNLIALDEFEFYLSQHPNRTVSQEARATIAFVRKQLGPAA